MLDAGEHEFLLQAPTGSGKTEVLLRVGVDTIMAGDGYIVILAPTRDLIRQHVTYFTERLAGTGLGVGQIHGGASPAERRETEDGLTSGAIRVVVGSAMLLTIDRYWDMIDASDLVFIDAPGTGFGRIAGPNKEKSFWGVDPDAHAFANFIVSFMSKYGRWNSPKYLFGESYGTTRSAVLVNMLETERNVDVNGVVLLSQILDFDLSIDQPEYNPGVDLPYVLALPTYAELMAADCGS